MTNEDILMDVKVLLDLEDTDLADGKLKILIRDTSLHLSNLLLDKPSTIPDNLSYIVTNVTIKRYNRIGSEGIKQDIEADHSLTFYDPDNDFSPYQFEIALYNEKFIEKKGHRGEVVWI